MSDDDDNKGGDEGGQDGGKPPTGSTLTPEEMASALADARKEAADNRTKRRELEEQYANEKAEFEKLGQSEVERQISEATEQATKAVRDEYEPKLRKVTLQAKIAQAVKRPDLVADQLPADLDVEDDKAVIAALKDFLGQDGNDIFRMEEVKPEHQTIQQGTPRPQAKPDAKGNNDALNQALVGGFGRA